MPVCSTCGRMASTAELRRLGSADQYACKEPCSPELAGRIGVDETRVSVPGYGNGLCILIRKGESYPSRRRPAQILVEFDDGRLHYFVYHQLRKEVT